MRARLCGCTAVCWVVFACQPPRTLDISAKPTRIDAHGQVARVLVSAGEADGTEAMGGVKISAAVGSLKQPETVTLLGGTGEVGFSCDVAADPGCTGEVTLTALWKNVTAQTTINVGGATGGGTGGGGGLSQGFIAACAAPVDGTVTASIHIDADDHFALYVNGALVDDSATLWYEPQTYTVSLFTHPSRSNVIAVKGANAFNGPDLDRAVIADVSWRVGSTTSHMVTGGQWKLTQTLSPGWETVGFADGAWPPAVVVGDNGVMPYGTVFGTSTAKWIWAYVPTGPASGKTLDDVVYTRVKFSLVENGLPAFNPPACP